MRRRARRVPLGARAWKTGDPVGSPSITARQGEIGCAGQSAAVPARPIGQTGQTGQTSSVGLRPGLAQLHALPGRECPARNVADIVLSDATALRSALREGSFGENIPELTSEMAAENGAIFA